MIAIVGGGLAALSLAWHLVSMGKGVTLFDPKGIGKGASGVSSGLCHPFPGKKGLLSWRGLEALKEAKELFSLSATILASKIKAPPGIFRPAFGETQENDFQQTSLLFPEEAIWDAKKNGLWIPHGETIFSSLYMEGLWGAILEKGGTLVKEKISSLKELSSFSHVALCAGEGSLPFLPEIPWKVTLGQALVCSALEPLSQSLVGEGHVALTQTPLHCQIGSTYEYAQTADPKRLEELLSKVEKFYPGASTLPVVERKEGFRLSRKGDYRPLVQRMGEKLSCLTGFGSRGLLYHALLGKELAGEIAR